MAADFEQPSVSSKIDALQSLVAIPSVARSPSAVNWFEVVDREDESVSTHDNANATDATWIVRLTNDAFTGGISVLDVGPLINSDSDPSSPTFDVIRGLGLPGLVLVRANPANQLGVYESLRGNENVEYFERNFRIQAQENIPDDPQFPQQLHLNNPSGYDIAAPSAWDVTTGSSEMVVAVLDSGLDYAHPDLASNVWINAGEIPAGLAVEDVDLNGFISFSDLNDAANDAFVSDVNGNGYIDADDLLADPSWIDGEDNDANTFVDDLFGWNFVNDDPAPQDNNGHGTHVTGVIAAEGNNAMGVAGTAWRSSVMVLKFLDENNSGDVKNAILAANYVNMMRRDYGVDVRVVNNSWVSLEGSSEALYQAFEESGVLDILVVASAGNGNVFRQPNNNDEPSFAAYPASFDLNNIISVTATDSSGDLVPYFNFGQTSVDLAAPGLDILSTEPNAGYGTRSGTSFAAPQVSGAALLIWANSPHATVAEVRQAILQSVEPHQSLTDRVSTGGRLNLRQALEVDTIAPRASLNSVSTVEIRDLATLDAHIPQVRDS